MGAPGRTYVIADYELADAVAAERGEHGCEQYLRQAAPAVAGHDADQAQTGMAWVVPHPGESRARLVHVINRHQVRGRIEMAVVEGVLAELVRVIDPSVRGARGAGR
jgi:hypothetical protein